MNRSAYYAGFWLLLLTAITGTLRAGGERDSLLTLAESLPDSQRAEKYREWTELFKGSQQSLCIAIGKAGISWAIDEKNPGLAADLLNTIGSAYYVSGEYVLALDCYQKSLRAYQEAGEQKPTGMVHINLGQLYRKQKEYEHARQEYETALDIYNRFHDLSSLAATYNHLGNLYEEWKGDLETALRCYNKSLEYAREGADSLSISYSYDFISGVYAQQGKFAEAIRLLEDALRIRRGLKDDFSIAVTLNNIGETYKLQKNLALAREYFLQSLEISERIRFKDLMAHTYQMMAEVSRDQGNFSDAYTYMELRSATRDSILSDRKNQQMAEMREKFEADKKQERIHTLEKEKELDRQRMINLRNYFISALVILSLGTLIAWLYVNQQRQRKLNRERLEQERVRTRAIIEAEEKERIRIARELHDGVGQLLAAVQLGLSDKNVEPGQRLEQTTGLVNDAIREVRSVSHSMMPDMLLKHGLGKAVEDLAARINGLGNLVISAQVSWQQRWEPAHEAVLYRVIQELFTNMIKHAGATKANLELHRFDDEISLILEDNGKGFDVNTAANGIGLQNMQSRIAYLGGHLILDSLPGRGTTAIVTIPLKTTET